MPKKLTLKQKTFAHEYISSGNATKAVLVAYDTDSPTTAQVIGSQNLSKLMVCEYVEQLLDSLYVQVVAIERNKWRARQGSNLRPLVPEIKDTLFYLISSEFI